MPVTRSLVVGQIDFNDAKVVDRADSFPGKQAAPLPGRIGDSQEFPEQQNAQRDTRLAPMTSAILSAAILNISP